MNKFYQVIVILYVSLIAFLLINVGANEEIHHRPKRFLSFKNNTRFFVRVNFKANMVPWNQLFAQALGFRINWDEPPDTFHPFRHLYRRDIYNNIQILLDRNGLNGFHCVRRAICEVESTDSMEIYHRILKMIFRRQSLKTDKWHNKTSEDCTLSTMSCPLSVLEVAPYTDIV